MQRSKWLSRSFSNAKSTFLDDKMIICSLIIPKSLEYFKFNGKFDMIQWRKKNTILSTEHINQLAWMNFANDWNNFSKFLQYCLSDAIFSHANENYYVCANLENYRENNKSGDLQSIIHIRMHIFSLRKVFSLLWSFYH